MMVLLIPLMFVDLQINFRCKPSFRESGSRNVREVRCASGAAHICGPPPFTSLVAKISDASSTLPIRVQVLCCLLTPRGWCSKRDVSLQSSSADWLLTGSKCRASPVLHILKLLHLHGKNLQTIFSGSFFPLVLRSS